METYLICPKGREYRGVVGWVRSQSAQSLATRNTRGLRLAPHTLRARFADGGVDATRAINQDVNGKF